MSSTKVNRPHRYNNPQHTTGATMVWFRSKHTRVLKLPSQTPDRNLSEILRQESKFEVHQSSFLHLSDLELFLKDWHKLWSLDVDSCLKNTPKYFQLQLQQ